MLYQLHEDEVRRLRAPLLPHFTGAEMLLVTFRTDPKVVAKILPHPLEQAPEPIGVAFVAWYPETNFGSVYHEGALFLQASHHGSPGLYCLSMPVDDDMAMVGGREIYGYPKKMAQITLQRTEEHVEGRVVRKGFELMRISFSATSSIGLRDLPSHMQPGEHEGDPCVFAPAYLFKFFASPDTKGLDYLPRLVRQVNVLRPRAGLLGGQATLTLGSSPYDPLGEVPVLEVLSATYGLWDNTMLPGHVVARAWRYWKFLPHAFFKSDIAATRLGWVAEPPGEATQAPWPPLDAAAMASPPVSEEARPHSH